MWGEEAEVMKRTIIPVGMYLILGFLMLVPHGSLAAEITLQHGVDGYDQGRDTFITQLWDADDNLGGYEDLECNKGLDDIGGTADAGRILVYFGLSDVVPEGITIVEARLELYNFDGEYDDTVQERSAYRMTAEWIEGTGTKDTIEDPSPNQTGAYWGHSGYATWSGGEYDDTLLDSVMLPARPGISSDGAWFSWTVTDAVRAWYHETAPNDGIILVGDGVGEWTVHYFRSNEYTEPTVRPRLVITYTSDGTNVNPTCDAGTYASHREGTTVHLAGTASDVNGDPLTYLWTQVSGPSITIQDAASLTASFVAPDVDESGATVTVRLTVDDGHGGTCTDDASIPITDSAGEGLIINHTCTDISDVPEDRIQAVRNTLRIWYGHTSHGSQITSGMSAMVDSLYSYNSGPGSLSYDERTDADLGHNGDLYWRDLTVDQLNNPDNDRNLVMWSWCGGVSDNTEAGITTYLQAMNQLETEYPGVTFIYMTGHLDGSGEGGNLHIRNNQIREYCQAHGKILYDFADIESYDPDGNYYLDLQANDNCDYYDGSSPRNWAVEWCAAHPGECSACACAHSQSLNCDLKARAFWYMLARVAGWDPNEGAEPSLSVDPDHLFLSATDGGTNPADGSFIVTNSGGGEMTYTIGDDADWLSVSPTGGASFGEGDTITVSVNISGLEVGTYNGTITVNAPGAANSPGSVNVHLTISPELPGSLLSPSDLVYRGAFRLPDREPDADDAETWEYGGEALAYRPDGDPGGDADGYPGSLFGTGNGIWNYVSEIGIPAPSLSRNVEDLNVAATIQDFHDVRGGIFEVWTEIPRIGLEYMPAQGDQASPKLYLAFGQHLHGEGLLPTHGWCEIDLSASNTAGGWYIGNESLYYTTGYLFTIPQTWADMYTGGATLAVGRYRDGGLSGTGPSLYAYAPWLDGNPPDPNTHLSFSSLLRYSSMLDDPTDFRMDGYRDPDEWEGGAWITAGDKTAVAFAGTKATGPYWWYGFYSPAGDGMPCVHTVGDIYCFNADGSNCAPELTGDCPGHADESRGWWSSRFDAQIIFYDPDDFASVADGSMEPYEPQPYAVLDIDDHLFLNATVEPDLLGPDDQRRYRIGEMAYDRDRGFLYIIEKFADGAKPVIHVFAISVAVEICNGIDDDGDGLIDEGFDQDDDGFTSCGGDCDDDNPAVHPDAMESCDGKDNDCDDFIDEEDAAGCRAYYRDADGDGYGVDGDSRCLCAPNTEELYTAWIGGDPNDADPNTIGGAVSRDMPLGSGWSMISLPVEPVDPRVSMLFPGAVAVFRFTSDYVLLNPDDYMEKGIGYWIYIPTAHTYTITGIPFDHYTISSVEDGWCMIGSTSHPSRVSVSTGVIRGVFCFSNRYEVTGVGNQIGLLEPCRGYWINCSEQTAITVEREPNS